MIYTDEDIRVKTFMSDDEEEEVPEDKEIPDLDLGDEDDEWSDADEI